jgi:hypothetical protein
MRTMAVDLMFHCTSRNNQRRTVASYTCFSKSSKLYVLKRPGMVVVEAKDNPVGSIGKKEIGEQKCRAS